MARARGEARCALTLTLTAALALAGCSGVPAPDLATDMSGRLRTGLPRATVTIVDPMTLSIHAPPASDVQLSLDNVSATCASTPDQCEATKQRVVQVVRELLASQSSTPGLETLRATVRRDDWLRAAGGAVPAAQGSLARPFVGDLVIVDVFDLPNSMRVVTSRDVERLGLDADAVHARALRNLGHALSSYPSGPVAPGSRVMSLEAGDSYEASRLLMPERWQVLAQRVAGSLVASVPRRDQVLFTGSANPDDVAELTRRSDQIFATGDHPVSRVLLELTPTGWTVRER